MRGLRLREAAVGLRLGGVDQVGELDRVLDEEDRDVVADEVPVALLGVELHGEAAHVAGEVGRALVAGDGGEADEDRRLLALALEEVGPGEVGERLVVLEVAVGAVAAGVDDALGDALVVEVEDLLAEVEVLQQRRAAGADLQRVLVVGDGHALLGGQRRLARVGRLVGLAPLAAATSESPYFAVLFASSFALAMRQSLAQMDAIRSSSLNPQPGQAGQLPCQPQDGPWRNRLRHPTQQSLGGVEPGDPREPIAYRGTRRR